MNAWVASILLDPVSVMVALIFSGLDLLGVIGTDSVVTGPRSGPLSDVTAVMDWMLPVLRLKYRD